MPVTVVMLDCSDLAVPREVMQHVVHVESSRNPFAIGVVGGYLARQPKSLEEALATVQFLKGEGYNFSVGISQVNRYNLAKYGLRTYAEAFQVCPNLQAGSRILRECYDRAQDWGKAFSCYYSGNFVTGFSHGYVQKIFASIRKSQSRVQIAQAEPIKVIPYSGVQRKAVRDDGVPVEASYPEALAVRSRHIETAESQPAIPVPGPGAVSTAAPRADLGIPTQVVGIQGDPYQARVLPAPPVARGNNSPALRKGGSLLQGPESSGKPENTAGAVAPGGTPTDSQQRAHPADRSFVF